MSDRTKRPVVIAVDDEPERAVLWYRDLWLGWTLGYFTSASRFLNALEAQQIARPEAVILDIMMPPPTGWDPRDSMYGTRTGLIILERIRQVWPDIPVMCLSAVNDSGVDETVAAAGRACVRVKFDVKDLDKELREFLASLSA